MIPKIVQVVVGLPVEGPFDYSIGTQFSDSVAVGQRVKVLFNRHPRLGVIVGFKQKSPFKKLNPIVSVLDAPPSLDQNALQLTRSLSQYYGCSWGEAIETYLPNSLRMFQKLDFVKRTTDTPRPVNKIAKNILVHDVTGDKRWPFLFSEIQNTLDQGEAVIFLVPEIAYVKGIVLKLQANLKCFPAVAALNKKLKPNEELGQWKNIKEGKIRLVVGSRSAVFAPVSALGLIVIYEEEHSSYRQEQMPHYHVHAVCEWRSQLEKCSLVWVSRAPSVELWKEAKAKKWERISFLPDHTASMYTIDMSNYGPKHSRISFPLQNFIQEALAKGQKVILYLNRRGFTTFTRCEHCGLIIKCERCDTPLIYFYAKKIMICRYCQAKKILPKICPQCQKAYLRSMGSGTEKLESEIARFYPQAKIFCYDKENQVLPQDCHIIIATQAILKEEKLEAYVVAVLDFDAQLNHPDFRSAHKAFATLIRLRQFAREKFLVQTRLPDHYSLKAASKMDFDFFYKEELYLRKELGLAPFKSLLLLKIRGVQEQSVVDQSQILFEELEARRSKEIEISEPYPEGIIKLRGQYRYNIMLKASSSGQLLKLVKGVLKKFKRKKGIIVTIYVDP